jgi:hypothetical protein
MQSFKKSFDQLFSANPSQLILGVIFVFYILFNIQTPAILAGPIDNLFGKVLVVAVAAVVFMKTNPVVGVLGFVVAYQLIKTASVTTGTYAMRHYLPSEESKIREMQSYNTENVQSVPLPAAQQHQAALKVQMNDQLNEQMQAITNIDGSLETEMVARMAPLVIHSGDSDLKYSPILDGQHSAAPVGEN